MAFEINGSTSARERLCLLFMDLVDCAVIVHHAITLSQSIAVALLSITKRECQFYALVTIFHSYSARRSGGRRGHIAQTASARGRRAPTFRRNLFVSAARSTHRSEGDADSARRDESHRWPGILSAGVASGRALARVG